MMAGTLGRRDMNPKVHVSTLQIIDREHFYKEAVVRYDKPISTEYDIDELKIRAAEAFGIHSYVGIKILFWKRLED